MRAFSFLALLPLIASAIVNALVIRTDNLPGKLKGWKPEDAPSLSKRFQPLTNAERFARGLPPKAPPTRIAGARRAGPSPIVARKVIKATYADDNTPAGYVSQSTISAAYKVTTGKDTAVHIEITLPGGQTTGSQIDIKAIDGANTGLGFPFLTLVTKDALSSSDIGTGSSNNIVLAGSNSLTSPGSPPQSGRTSYSSVAPYETAVWTVDIASNTISAQWINTDGSPAPTYFALSSSSTTNYIAATGDMAAFKNAIPIPANRRPITLSLEDY